MVGLVLVSHSHALAKALQQLASQVAAMDLPIAIAAGVGDDRALFGTDAIDISEAIQQVMGDDGVMVLMDLGSAVLSAQLAVDLLPPEIGSKVRFCAAPLVEGAIAAAVQIGLGSNLETVCAEASQALRPKAEQIGTDESAQVMAYGSESAGAPSTDVQNIEGKQTIVTRLINPHGLHVRPAAKFVKAAAAFESTIQVENLTNHKGPVLARSLTAVSTLGAVGGHEVRLTASGIDAQAALETLRSLIASGFGETDAAPSSTATLPGPENATGGAINKPIPISEGVALAPLYIYHTPPPEVSTTPTEDAEGDWQALKIALHATKEQIQARSLLLKKTLNANDAAIFDAHLLILQDPDLIEIARRGVFEQKMNAAQAWQTAFGEVASSYRQLEDTYLRQRAADIEDVGTQVLFTLAGKPAASPITLQSKVILYAQDLTPTETSLLDMRQVLGIITAAGGPTSHTAILARAFGIPALAGVSGLFDRQSEGKLVAINGFTGELWVEPSSEIQTEILKKRIEWLSTREALLKNSQELAHTQDGRRIEVFANIGSVTDAQAAVKNNAEGVGLLRTEFLFLTRQTPPSEEEQMIVLRQIFETIGPNPVTVRTLDVGGDKELPYIHLPPEANPFLGVRALRLSLAQPNLFVAQLRAILRAAEGYRCRIMYPMVADANEIRQARVWLEKTHAALLADQVPHAWPVEVGIMVEIPSAALLSADLAKEVDFFSIGTNDLTQYTLAAERGNPQLSHLADGLHPAVLRLISQVAQAAHREGKWAGICGELGGDPVAAPILVGLGIDELSLNPAGIPRIKALIKGLTMPEAEKVARKALSCQTSAEVRKIAQEFLDARPVS